MADILSDSVNNSNVPSQEKVETIKINGDMPRGDKEHEDDEQMEVDEDLSSPSDLTSSTKKVLESMPATENNLENFANGHHDDKSKLNKMECDDDVDDEENDDDEEEEEGEEENDEESQEEEDENDGEIQKEEKIETPVTNNNKMDETESEIPKNIPLGSENENPKTIPLGPVNNIDSNNEPENADVVENGILHSSRESADKTEDSNVPPLSIDEEEVVNLSMTKKSDEENEVTDVESKEEEEAVDLSSSKDAAAATNDDADSTKKCEKLSLDITPRRSSRKLNKPKSYAEKDLLLAQIEEANKLKSKLLASGSIDDEIEEVTPHDPLAEEGASGKSTKNRSKPIIVNDTKGLVEFASSTRPISNNSKSANNKPTLVIIDTNSILSGRGPIPISHAQTTALIGQNTQISLTPSGGSKTTGAGFSMIPISSLPSQNAFSSTLRNPPSMKPIVIAPVAGTSTSSAGALTSTPVSSSATPKAPVILPSLTDDMFVVEAPSFIVPYVYEKPPKESLKLFIERLETNIKEIEAKERIEKVNREKKEVEEQLLESQKAKEQEQGKNKEIEEPDSKTPVIQEDEKKGDGKMEDRPEEEKMDVDKQEGESEKVAAKSEDDSADKMDVEKEKDEPSKKLEYAEKVGDILKDPADKKVEEVGAASLVEKITKKPSSTMNSYFDNPLGKFFMQIGLNLVQEHVQTDLLRTQRRKRDREGGKCSEDVTEAINTLAKTLEFSKENNDPFKLEMKKCDLCSFKTEAILVMNHHLETPHMKNYTYRCNFCPLEFRSPHDILFHMEAEHCVRGRLERAPCFHQCPNCPFEDNQKGKLTRHLISCSKKYRHERNQEPPLDWEPPAKIPRVTRNRPPSMNPTNAVYQAAMSGIKQVQPNTLLPKLMPVPGSVAQNILNRNRPVVKSVAEGAAPFIVNNRLPLSISQANALISQRSSGAASSFNSSMVYKTAGSSSQPPVLLSASFQMNAAQLYQQQAASKQLQQQQAQQQGLAAAKLLQQPSISITPLPRQSSASSSGASGSSNSLAYAKPGKPPNNTNNKLNCAFVICEICDGYIKDLEQLRNHMQWIHKVKIHPKMIYNRPPLNCQKCQFRFFTDQGLERHLLGSHGLVTSSMQEAANKGKDGGRCPVCGRVYQWKLLNHVARDHSMALKPAHLSYKCTVCTATFGMYKQFESHVYSAHSVVAKRAIENKKPSSSSSQSEALLKPLKINDEITIIPQPARIPKPNNKVPAGASSSKEREVKEEEEDNGCWRLCKACINQTIQFASKAEWNEHLKIYHLKNFNIKLIRCDEIDYLVTAPDIYNTFEDCPVPINDINMSNISICKPFDIKIPRIDNDGKPDTNILEYFHPNIDYFIPNANPEDVVVVEEEKLEEEIIVDNNTGKHFLAGLMNCLLTKSKSMHIYNNKFNPHVRPTFYSNPGSSGVSKVRPMAFNRNILQNKNQQRNFQTNQQQRNFQANKSLGNFQSNLRNNIQTNINSGNFQSNIKNFQTNKSQPAGGSSNFQTVRKTISSIPLNMKNMRLMKDLPQIVKNFESQKLRFPGPTFFQNSKIVYANNPNIQSNVRNQSSGGNFRMILNNKNQTPNPNRIFGMKQNGGRNVQHYKMVNFDTKSNKKVLEKSVTNKITNKSAPSTAAGSSTVIDLSVSNSVIDLISSDDEDDVRIVENRPKPIFQEILTVESIFPEDKEVVEEIIGL